MDSYNPVHILGLLSDSLVWHYEFRFCRSLLLDSCDSRLESWNTYGAWYITNCNIWTDYAAVGRRQNH